jgi:hypothetical protein
MRRVILQISFCALNFFSLAGITFGTYNLQWNNDIESLGPQNPQPKANGFRWSTRHNEQKRESSYTFPEESSTKRCSNYGIFDYPNSFTYLSSSVYANNSLGLLNNFRLKKKDTLIVTYLCGRITFEHVTTKKFYGRGVGLYCRNETWII